MALSCSLKLIYCAWEPSKTKDNTSTSRAALRALPVIPHTGSIIPFKCLAPWWKVITNLQHCLLFSEDDSSAHDWQIWAWKMRAEAWCVPNSLAILGPERRWGKRKGWRILALQLAGTGGVYEWDRKQNWLLCKKKKNNNEDWQSNEEGLNMEWI